MSLFFFLNHFCAIYQNFSSWHASIIEADLIWEFIPWTNIGSITPGRGFYGALTGHGGIHWRNFEMASKWWIDSSFTDIISYVGCAISSHLFHYQRYSWDDVNLKELCSPARALWNKFKRLKIRRHALDSWSEISMEVIVSCVLSTFCMYAIFFFTMINISGTPNISPKGLTNLNHPMKKFKIKQIYYYKGNRSAMTVNLIFLYANFAAEMSPFPLSPGRLTSCNSPTPSCQTQCAL